MALSIASLNSGSNGNCYYIGNDSDAILVDAGISCREIEKRMGNLSLDVRKIKALFISHEHSDHIKGVDLLAKRLQLPVYITHNTLRHSRLSIPPAQVFTFKAGEPISIGELTITSFAKHHDAVDPCSFIITCRQVCVGVFTDIGKTCQDLIKHFGQCHAAFLEANYDEQMLDSGSYPYHLKRRIKGGKGHLSNRQALDLFLNHRPAFMSHLLLAHLSAHNNCPDLVENLFKQCAGGVQTIVASRFQESALYYITANEGHFNKPGLQIAKPTQLAFSFV